MDNNTLELLAEANRRGILPQDKKALYDEAVSRGLIPGESASAQDNPYSAKNIAGAAIEPNLSLASGAIAAPVAGIAGLATGAGRALGLTDKDPADVVRSVGSALTYEPKTSGGKIATQAVTAPFRAIADAADYVGGKTTDLTGSAALGAAVNTGMQMAAPSLIAKGASTIMPTRAASKLSTDQALLNDAGVQMTPGQMRGGWVNTIEQAFTSIPFLGDIVRDARHQSTASLNKAVINDVTSSVGVPLPGGIKGHDAIQFARQTLGEKYDALLLKMHLSLDGLGTNPQVASNAAMRPTLRDTLADIKRSASSLPPQQLKDLNRIIDTNIVDRIQANGGVIDGNAVKAIQETLRTEREAYGRGGTYERKVAVGLKEAEAAVREGLRTDNPQFAAELSQIDAGYGKFKIVQKAATYGKDGMFTPLQLLNAIKAKDVTKDKRAYTEGEAGRGMQPLAEAARRVLPNTVADSGTPTRAMVAHAALGGALAHFANPTAAATAAIVPSIYNPYTMRLLQNMAVDPVSGGYAGTVAAPIGAGQYVNTNRDLASLLQKQQGR